MHTKRSAQKCARVVWLGYIFILCAIEAPLLLADAGVFGSPIWRPWLWQNGGFWVGLLYGWTPNYAAQPITMFFTYAFIHAGSQHLAGNVVTLAWLGYRLETVLSPVQLLALCVVSMVGGAIMTGFLATSPRPVVGASGVIMGLIAVWIAADAREMLEERAGPVRVFGAVFSLCVVVGFLNWIAAQMALGGLAWHTHLGGFTFAVLAMAMIPALRPAQSWQRR